MNAKKTKDQIHQGKGADVEGKSTARGKLQAHKKIGSGERVLPEEFPQKKPFGTREDPIIHKPYKKRGASPQHNKERENAPKKKGFQGERGALS